MSEEQGTIISEIAAKSRSEAESLIATARRVAEREVSSAARRAATRERLAARELEARIAAEKARAEAQVAADVQRMKLRRRHELVEHLMADALQALADEPADEAHGEMLERLVVEAAGALSLPEAVVIFSARDKEFLAAEGRFEEMAARVKKNIGVAISLSDETVDAGGVIARSGDGSVCYYNTFEEIAYRMRSELRRRLAEELFR